MTCKEIITNLKSFSNPQNVAGMARFGINPQNTLGVSIPILRKLAKEIGKDHQLAAELWDSGIHEARILASIIDDPDKVTEKQMDDWVKDFDSWDVCDQVCSNLFDKTVFAYKKAIEWSSRSEPARNATPARNAVSTAGWHSVAGGEFVKRAAFAVIAALAVQDKTAADKQFLQFFPIIKREANDERNFVKKAVNWALRNIGKRNSNLNKAAIKTAQDLLKSAKDVSTSGRKARMWIASDALRELTSRRFS